MSKSELRFCADIGLWALDFDKSTCRFKTKYCMEKCYNCNLYSLYDLEQKDKRNMRYFDVLNGEIFKDDMSKKRRGNRRRFRFATRGEAFHSFAAIDKIVKIAKKNPGIVFWIPTRAWRVKRFKLYIEIRVFPVENIHVMASLDPSNSIADYDTLRRSNWDTIFFGNDDLTIQSAPVKCKKTWDHKVGHCAKCRKGCFSKNRVDVWLKSH